MTKERRIRPLFTWRSAICDSDLAPLTRLVGFVLSTHMSERGDSCMPSVATVAREAGLSENAARKHLHDLRDRGWVMVLEKGGGRGNPTVYGASVPATLCGGKGSTPVPLSDAKTLHLTRETLHAQPLNPPPGGRGGRTRTYEDAPDPSTNGHYQPPSLDAAREYARTYASIETVEEDELRAELRSKGCTDDVIELACETFRHRREGIPA